MNLINTDYAIRLTFLILLVAIFPGISRSQGEMDTAETAFDYVQMKRSYARQLWTKENADPRELSLAIRLLRELLAFLDKPEVRAFQETYQNLKSQRADVRYEWAKAAMRAGREPEVFRALDELADEAMSSVYADWLDGETDRAWFVRVREQVQFKDAIGRIRAIDRFGKQSPLSSPYRKEIGEDEKVAGLSLFWSMARTSFAYFDRIPETDWDQVYLEFLPKVRATKSTYEYYRVMQEMCALLRDGHTNVYLPRELFEEMAARPPLRTRLVEGKVVVERVLSDALRRQGISPGLELVSIDEMPTLQYAEKNVRPFQSSSTPQDSDVRTYTYELLAGPKSQQVMLGLRDTTGRAFTRSISRTGYADVAPAFEKAFEFKVLGGNVGYVALNSFENDSAVRDFLANFDRLAATDALVIDLRENGGGNSDFGDQILSYLIDKPVVSASWRSRQFRPLLRAYGIQSDWYGKKGATIAPNRARSYSKPVALLIGPRTFSAAEDFAMMFAQAKRGPLVGEPTGGSTGQPMGFALPGGGWARVCVKRDTYPDGKTFVGKGVLPTSTVRPKVSDFTSHKDSVLEAALAELRTK